jgi:hypothetical protein
MMAQLQSQKEAIRCETKNILAKQNNILPVASRYRYLPVTGVVVLPVAKKKEGISIENQFTMPKKYQR